jgi:perosamine synthetase
MPGNPVLQWGICQTSHGSIPSVLDAKDFRLTRSARSALALALRHVGIGPGARVLLPNYYCPTMPAPVEASGASVLFYPITSTGLPDLNWIREHVSRDCKAMLVVHFFGLPLPLAAVREFCDATGLFLIEDCAHAFFGKWSEVPVGSAGHYAIASLPKFFPVIEGGVLAGPAGTLPDVCLPAPSAAAELKAVWNLVETAALYERLPGLNALIALASKVLSAVRGRSSATAADPQTDGSEHVEAVRAAALADPLLVPMQLRRVEQRLVERLDRQRVAALRRRNYERLAELLPAAPGMAPLFPHLPPGAVPYVFPVRLQEPDNIYAQLRAQRLPVLRWNRYWPGAIDSTRDVGRDWGHHVLQILCHQDLTLADLDTLAHSLTAAVGAGTAARSTG